MLEAHWEAWKEAAGNRGMEATEVGVEPVVPEEATEEERVLLHETCEGHRNTGSPDCRMGPPCQCHNPSVQVRSIYMHNLQDLQPFCEL